HLLGGAGPAQPVVRVRIRPPAAFAVLTQLPVPQIARPGAAPVLRVPHLLVGQVVVADAVAVAAGAADDADGLASPADGERGLQHRVPLALEGDVGDAGPVQVPFAGGGGAPVEGFGECGGGWEGALGGAGAAVFASSELAAFGVGEAAADAV